MGCLAQLFPFNAPPRFSPRPARANEFTGVRAAIDATHRVRTGTPLKGPAFKLLSPLVEAMQEAKGAPGPAHFPARTRASYLGSDYRGLHVFDVGADTVSLYLLAPEAFPADRQPAEVHQLPPGGLWRYPLHHPACTPAHTVPQWLGEMGNASWTSAEILAGAGKLRTAMSSWAKESERDARLLPAVHAHAKMLEALLGSCCSLVDEHMAKQQAGAMGFHVNSCTDLVADADADAADAVAIATEATGADWRLSACAVLLHEVLCSLPDSALLLAPLLQGSTLGGEGGVLAAAPAVEAPGALRAQLGAAIDAALRPCVLAALLIAVEAAIKPGALSLQWARRTLRTQWLGSAALAWAPPRVPMDLR
ncbi:hypothetical protein T492DRAFT_866126 [Pavlovales sp. CCMP2436]|nr:hypothetical protein T492DRAFT_866126 [Pavlovales sp. CCMP2436]